MRNFLSYLKLSFQEFIKHPNPKSLYNCLKYYSSWRLYNGDGRNSVTEKMPWISFEAIDFLKKIARPDMEVFEYGSGGSTLFWASKVRHVVSVEHDRSWFEKMRTELGQQGFSNVEYLLSEPHKDQHFIKKNFVNPADYISSDQQYTGMSFEEYARTIDRYPDGHFDVIIVDGRVRPSCILHSIGKLKQGGYLVVDNTERKYYLSPFPFTPPEWVSWNFSGPVPFLRGFSETTILKRTS